MTTVTWLSRRCGWGIRGASIAFSLVFCASLFAGPNNNIVVVPAKQHAAQKKAKKLCYTMSTTSGIPIPCNELGAIPTTACPMLILGHTPPRE